MVPLVLTLVNTSCKILPQICKIYKICKKTARCRKMCRLVLYLMARSNELPIKWWFRIFHIRHSASLTSNLSAHWLYCMTSAFTRLLRIHSSLHSFRFYICCDHLARKIFGIFARHIDEIMKSCREIINFIQLDINCFTHSFTRTVVHFMYDMNVFASREIAISVCRKWNVYFIPKHVISKKNSKK